MFRKWLLLARAVVRALDSCVSAPLAPLGERGPGVRGADSTPRGVSLLLRLLIRADPNETVPGLLREDRNAKSAKHAKKRGCNWVEVMRPPPLAAFAFLTF